MGNNIYVTEGVQRRQPQEQRSTRDLSLFRWNTCLGSGFFFGDVIVSQAVPRWCQLLADLHLRPPLSIAAIGRAILQQTLHPAGDDSLSLSCEDLQLEYLYQVNC